ncbi:RDD family protein [Planctomycetota bacterium]
MIEEIYRTFWRRVAASIIDRIIFLPFAIITSFVIRSDSVLLIGLWDQFLYWAWILYSVLLHGYRGQTIGKMACNVKVKDLSLKPLSMKQAVLRDIVPILSMLVFTCYAISHFDVYYSSAMTAGLVPKWIIVVQFMSVIWAVAEIITMLTNNKRRAIHDFVAGSVVCREVPLAKGATTSQIMTDFVIGANLKKRDNLISAFACVLCGLMGAGIAVLVKTDFLVGLVAGLFSGLVISSVYFFVVKLASRLKDK